MISERVIGVMRNGQILDLQTIQFKLEQNDIPINIGEQFSINIIRHTFAHILAQALKQIYSDVNFSDGPVTSDGFYYDIKMSNNISTNDFPQIEKAMHQIIDKQLDVIREVTKRNIITDPFKKQILDKIPNTEELITYKQGDFVDLCRGPHVYNTKCLKDCSFKLTKVSGLDGGLQRIEGLAFLSEQQLKEHLINLEQLANYDHRVLLEEMELAMFSDLSPGSVFWQPNGVILLNIMKNLILRCYGTQYQNIQTPALYNNQLWEKTGHLAQYRENMFIYEDLALKPMSCPAHVLYFKNKVKSYRDLPLRIAEFGCCFRNEKHGGLCGLKRLRNFVQDDAHIFCTKDQIESEVSKFLDLALGLYKQFGFDNIIIKLATRPVNYIGDLEAWNLAENLLKKAINRPFLINTGDGAFYGPKIELYLHDNYGREWQCGTIQLDFFICKNLDAYFYNHNGEQETPIVLHRAALGAFERFLSILLENTKGHLPLWLNPVQCIILPISNKKHYDYAKQVKEKLNCVLTRINIDYTDETLSKKLKTSMAYRSNFIIIVGDKEMNNQTISVRQKNSNFDMSIEEFLKTIENKFFS